MPKALDEFNKTQEEIEVEEYTFDSENQIDYQENFRIIYNQGAFLLLPMLLGLLGPAESCDSFVAVTELLRFPRW